MLGFLRKQPETGMIFDDVQDNDPRNLLYDDFAPLAGEQDIPNEGDVEKGSWTLNQNKTTACTCHSTVHAINQVLGRELSARYAFYKIKTDPKYRSSQLPYGAYMIDSIKLMIDEGIAEYFIAQNLSTESDKAYLAYSPTVTVTESAKRNKGGAYLYVTSGSDNLVKFDSIRRYMFEQQKPVKVGVQWRGSFNAARKGGIVPVEQPTGSTSGHDMLAVAWKRINGHEYLGFRNSWGPSWGDNGRIWLPKGFFKISAAIAYLPPEVVKKVELVIPDKMPNRDYVKEKYMAQEIRRAVYAKFPLDVNLKAAKANEVARALMGSQWLLIVQAITYRGWTITDLVNFLYARSRNKTDSKAFNLDLSQNKV